MLADLARNKDILFINNFNLHYNYELFYLYLFIIR
jgi:hypothetical protein